MQKHGKVKWVINIDTGVMYLMYYVMSSPQIKAQNNYQSNYAHFCHLSKNKTWIFNEL